MAKGMQAPAALLGQAPELEGWGGGAHLLCSRGHRICMQERIAKRGEATLHERRSRSVWAPVLAEHAVQVHIARFILWRLPRPCLCALWPTHAFTKTMPSLAARSCMHMAARIRQVKSEEQDLMDSADARTQAVRPLISRRAAWCDSSCAANPQCTLGSTRKPPPTSACFIASKKLSPTSSTAGTPGTRASSCLYEQLWGSALLILVSAQEQPRTTTLQRLSFNSPNKAAHFHKGRMVVSVPTHLCRPACARR